MADTIKIGDIVRARWFDDPVTYEGVVVDVGNGLEVATEKLESNGLVGLVENAAFIEILDVPTVKGLVIQKLHNLITELTKTVSQISNLYEGNPWLNDDKELNRVFVDHLFPPMSFDEWTDELTKMNNDMPDPSCYSELN